MPSIKHSNQPPGWLAQKIAACQRHATYAKCPRCAADILTGQSDDLMWWTATVDPTPVDELAEALARAADRHSYDAIPRGKHVHLYTRQLEHMDHPRTWPVMIDHLCDGRTVTPADYPDAAPEMTPDDPWSLFA